MRTVALLVVGIAQLGWSHEADVVRVVLKRDPMDGTVRESVSMTPATLAMLVPVDADGNGELSQVDLDAKAAAVIAGLWDEMPLQAGGKRCVLAKPNSRIREGQVDLDAQLGCGQGELRQDFRLLQVLPANYRVMLTVVAADGHEGPHLFAQGSMTSLTVPQSVESSAVSRLLGGAMLGVHRGLSLDVLGAIVSVVLTLTTRRAVAWALTLAVGSLGLCSALAVPVLVPSALLVGAVIAARWNAASPVAAALIGAAIGLRHSGGDALAACAAMAGSSALLLVTFAAGSVGARRLGAQLVMPSRMLGLMLTLVGVVLNARGR
jgi:hypothetical protein